MTSTRGLQNPLWKHDMINPFTYSGVNTHTSKDKKGTDRLSAGAVALSANTLSGHYIQHEIFMTDAGVCSYDRIWENEGIFALAHASPCCMHFACVYRRLNQGVCVLVGLSFVWKRTRLELHSAPDVLLIRQWQQGWNISCQPEESGLQKLQFSLLVLQRPSLYFNLAHLHKRREIACVCVCV